MPRVAVGGGPWPGASGGARPADAGAVFRGRLSRRRRLVPAAFASPSLLPAPFSSGPRFLLGCSSSPGPLPSSRVTAVSAPVPRVPAAGRGSQRAQCPLCMTQLALAVEQDLPRGPAPLSLIGPGRHLSLLCGGFSLFRVVVFSSIWRGLRVHILSLWMLHPNPQALAPVLLASLLSLLCSCRLGVFLSCEFSCAPEVPCFILAQPVLV